MKFKDIIPRINIEQIIDDCKRRQPANTGSQEKTQQKEHSIYLLPYNTVAGTKEYFPVCFAAQGDLGTRKVNVFSDAESLESVLNSHNNSSGKLVKNQIKGILKELPIASISAGSLVAVGLVPHNLLIKYIGQIVSNPYPILNWTIFTSYLITTFCLRLGLVNIKNRISNMRYINTFSSTGGIHKEEITEIAEKLSKCRVIYTKDSSLCNAFEGLKPDKNISSNLWTAANVFLYFNENTTGPASADFKSMEIYRNIVGMAYTE